MTQMVSPYSRKAVDVPDGLVDRFRVSGFRELSVEEPRPEETDKAEAAPAPRKRRARKQD
jgi:hypothetical protein